MADCPAPVRSFPASSRSLIEGVAKRKSVRRAGRQGWEGWDEYAPFYDWENAQTIGRRDVRFWSRLARQVGGRVLELGSGTGRLMRPLSRAGIDIVGIDRSERMLDVAKRRSRSLALIRGDIRALPFEDQRFDLVLAPYGLLQSVTKPGDLERTLAAVARVLVAGGSFGVDLVPDVPNWQEYRDRVQLRGKARGAEVTLVESVRQDRRRRLTTFEERYIERRLSHVTEHRFELTFRSLTVPQMTAALERAGFSIDAVLGDYDGRPWDPRADVWIVIARRRAPRRKASR